MAKQATKKTAKRASNVSAMKSATGARSLASSSVDKEPSPVGDVGMRTLRAGTVVFLPGSETPLTLASDVSVAGERIDRDAKFVGMLARHPDNWVLNISQVEGVWSPVTCTRQDEPEA